MVQMRSTHGLQAQKEQHMQLFVTSRPSRLSGVHQLCVPLLNLRLVIYRTCLLDTHAYASSVDTRTAHSHELLACSYHNSPPHLPVYLHVFTWTVKQALSFVSGWSSAGRWTADCRSALIEEVTHVISGVTHATSARIQP